MTQYLPSRMGTLAQALDEAIPEGVTGMEAAKAVADFLDARGFVIQPKEWRCETCGKTFPTFEAKHRHKVDKHTPYRDLSAKDRPADRGDIPCGFCDRSFANEQNAHQHRRDAHGIREPYREAVDSLNRATDRDISRSQPRPTGRNG